MLSKSSTSCAASPARVAFSARVGQKSFACIFVDVNLRKKTGNVVEMIVEQTSRAARPIHLPPARCMVAVSPFISVKELVHLLAANCAFANNLWWRCCHVQHRRWLGGGDFAAVNNQIQAV